MKRTEQRVALAKDVLKQIASKQYTIMHGEYIGGALHNEAVELDSRRAFNTQYRYTQPKKEQDMRDLLEGDLKGAGCKVCSKGALFMAHILRNDRVTLSEFVNVSLGYIQQSVKKDGRKNPIPAFTPRQLDEIEVLFEGKSFIDGNAFSTSEGLKLKAALKKLFRLSPENRLAAIMRRIIRNKGTKVVL